MKTDLLLILVLVSVLTTAAVAAQEAPSVSRPTAQPEQPAGYGDYQTAELVSLVRVLAESHKQAEAIEAGTEALSRALAPIQDAAVRFYMAKSYESLPKSGPLAKQYYEDVLKMHPDFDHSALVAYRLAELNSSVVMENTEANDQRAVELFEQVLGICEDRNEAPQKVYYVALKAHMALGNLYWDRNDYARSRGHFQKIYDCDPVLAEPMPCEHFDSPEALAQHRDWLRERIVSMKKRIPGKLVGLCLRSSWVDTLRELGSLVAKYSSDAAVAEPAMRVQQETSHQIMEDVVNEAVDSFLLDSSTE